MKYQAVIFDLFGTLLDFLTDDEYKAAHANVAEILGAPLDDFRQVWSSTIRDRDRGFFGSLEGDLANAARLLGLKPGADQLHRAAEVRLKLYAKNLTPRKGAIETLTALRASGLKVGLITGCAWEVPALWPDTHFVPLMDFTVFSCVAGMSKPDPRIYELACEGLGVRPEDCLYVGDGGYYELAGARQVGMDAVLIKVADDPYPYTSRQEALEWQGPTISSLLQLLDLVNAVSLED